MNRVWYRRSYLAFLLWPFSVCYRWIVSLRRLCYQLGIKKTVHLSVPVIVVGNITVGGTGKTPLVIALAAFLIKQGYKPGIISRGYGGRVKNEPCWVDAFSKPEWVGDEPVLIAKSTGCPVVVAPNRVLAAQTLLSKTDCNLIISDDGLQHYRLARTLEIAIVDGQRRFGNGFCLPAGPLREPIKRLAKVDFIVSNGKRQGENEYEMSLLSGQIYNISKPTQLLTNTESKRVWHAVAGIGNPARFFNHLRALGYTIIEHAFPDHYKFKYADIDFGKGAWVMMTEKDAVKCQSFADERHWCLPVQAILENKFYAQLLEKLHTTKLN